MNKYQLYALGGMLLAAVSLGGCVNTASNALPPDAPPGQVQAAKATDAQASFDKACKYGSGVLAAAAPVIPAVRALLVQKLGINSGFALDGFVSTVKTACDPANPLDVNNTAAITQRIYDAGGNIVALIIKSQTS